METHPSFFSSSLNLFGDRELSIPLHLILYDDGARGASLGAAAAARGGGGAARGGGAGRGGAGAAPPACPTPSPGAGRAARGRGARGGRPQRVRPRRHRTLYVLYVLQQVIDLGQVNEILLLISVFSAVRAEPLIYWDL